MATMFPSSNLHDRGSNTGISSSTPLSSQQQQQPEQQQQPHQQPHTQEGMLQERRDSFAEKMDAELWGCPFGLPFVEDPFFAAVLPFRAVDGFLCGAAADSVAKLMAEEQRELRQRRRLWSGDSWRSSNSASTWPAFFYSDFFEPELFAPAPSPLFRKPWWRPSFWVQQRQLDQQQQLRQEQQSQQQQQPEEQHKEPRQQYRRQEQRPGGVSRALLPSNKDTDASAVAAEDEIPIIFTKSKRDNRAVPAEASSDKSRNLLHPAADPASAAAAEEQALQMRRLKWLTDPFFSDPFSLYLPRSWEVPLQNDGAASAAGAARSTAAATVPVGAPAARRPSATANSTPSGAPTTAFVPFASLSVAAAVPSAVAARSADASPCAAPDAACLAPLPRIDIRDCGDVLLVDAEVPGFHKENLHVSIEGKSLLRISGQQRAQQQPPPRQQPPPQQQRQNPKEEEHQGEGSFYLQERPRSSSFSRAIPLPGNIKENDIRASMSDGVLHLRIPKEQAPVVKPSRVIAIE